MNEIRTIISKPLQKLMDETATIIHTNRDTKYYFLPYWFESTDKEDVFIMHHLDGKERLPEELVRELETRRLK